MDTLAFAYVAPERGLMIPQISRPEGAGAGTSRAAMAEPGLPEGGGWQPEVLSYEAPTYFGMNCAAHSR